MKLQSNGEHTSCNKKRRGKKKQQYREEKEKEKFSLSNERTNKKAKINNTYI